MFLTSDWIYSHSTSGVNLRVTQVCEVNLNYYENRENICIYKLMNGRKLPLFNILIKYL